MKELAPQDAKGGYSRPMYDFDGRIGSAEFPVESGRYHLYVGNACPWCHRVMLALAILGLDQHISYTWLTDDAERASRGGWIFDPSTGFDPVYGAADLREVYDASRPGFRGRCTAPLLVDRATKQIVCNDSSLILDTLYALARQLPGCAAVDLRPRELSARIQELDDFIYKNVNNAVYRSGFATTQAGYDEAQRDLEAGLAAVEALLAEHRFLCGERFTDADLRLFPTVVRYDAVYCAFFRCTRRRIASDFPHIHAWMRDVWLLPAGPGTLQVKDTYGVDAARRSYYGQLFPLNPSGIIPSGPTAEDLQLGVDPGRGALDREAVFFRWEGARAQPSIGS